MTVTSTALGLVYNSRFGEKQGTPKRDSFIDSETESHKTGKILDCVHVLCLFCVPDMCVGMFVECVRVVVCILLL